MPYILSLNFAGIELLKDNPRADRCQACGFIRNKWEKYADTKKKLSGDIGATHDGFDLVSKRFKEIMEHCEIRGVVFDPLSSGDFQLRFYRSVETDRDHQRLVFLGDPCATCGEYREILTKQIYPKLAKDVFVAEDEIVRSIQQVGSVKKRHHQIYVGDRVQKCLVENKIKRIAIRPLTPFNRAGAA